MNDAALTRCFKSLGHETRLRILRFLLARGSKTVSEICAEIGGSAQPTISVHLDKMRDAGILDCERQGQNVVYRVDRSAVASLIEEFAALAQLFREDAPA